MERILASMEFAYNPNAAYKNSTNYGTGESSTYPDRSSSSPSSSSSTSSGSGSSHTYMFIVISVGILLFILLLIAAMSLYRRYFLSYQNRDLEQALLDGQDENVRYRVDAAGTEVELGTKKCRICDFDNFLRVDYCSLCGTSFEVKTKAVEEQMNASSSMLVMEHLTPKQLRARYRHEWKRKVDVDGNLYWYRDNKASPETSSNAPGYSVVMSNMGDDPVPSEAVAFEFKESSQTDASQLSIESISVPAERTEFVLEMMEKNFPAKYAHFVASCSELIIPPEVQYLRLKIHRNFMLEESISHLSCLENKDIRSVLRVEFIQENGVDAGGLQREWFMLLAKYLTADDIGLFHCIDKTDQTYYLNPNSLFDNGDEHLVYYRAAGILVGRALLEGNLLPIHLSIPLLKLIVGTPISLEDLQFTDKELYTSLSWIMENNGVDKLELTFSVTEVVRDEVKTIDLVPDGRNIVVTDENKAEFIRLKLQYLLVDSVNPQLYAFLNAIYDIIPAELLMIFDFDELDFILSGTDTIDVEDWKANTVVTPNLEKQEVVEWFWDIVSGLPQDSLVKLLQFSTGCSRVPVNGFKALTSYDGRLCPFTLKGIPLYESEYLRAHACFNRIDLPLYEKKEDLVAMMSAILSGSIDGFTDN